MRKLEQKESKKYSNIAAIGSLVNTGAKMTMFAKYNSPLGI